jgi:AraC-like DNA-binding protein
MKASGLLPGKMAMARDPESMLRLIDLMLLRSGSVTDGSRVLCADYLRALLRLCAETVPLNRRSKNPSDCYRRAIVMIDADYAGIRSVSDLARRLDVTPEHLTRTFKSMGDEAPLKRITLRKLQHASDLLIAGGSKVKIVAAELGYANPFHFSAVFRRHFGYSPRALQRRVRGGARSVANINSNKGKSLKSSVRKKPTIKN